MPTTYYEEGTDEYLSTKDLVFDGVDPLRDTMVLDCPTGYGKTFFTINGSQDSFAKALEIQTGRKINSILIVQPLTMLKEQTERYDGVQELTWNVFNRETVEGVYTSTVAKIASWLYGGEPHTMARFDLIVVDEVDYVARLVKAHDDDMRFWQWFKRAQDGLETLTAALTATPELLTYWNKDDGYLRFKIITKKKRFKYKSGKVSIYPWMKLDTYLKATGLHKGDMVFERSATRCKQMAKKYKAGFIVSKWNDKEVDGSPLNESMHDQKIGYDGKPFGGKPRTNLYDFVKNNATLPEEYSALVMNDSVVVGVNFKPEAANETCIKRMIIESTEVDTIKQFRGRVRGDIEELVIVVNGSHKASLESEIREFEAFVESAEHDPEAIERRRHMEIGAMEQAQTAHTRLEMPLWTYTDLDGNTRIRPFVRGYYRRQKHMLERMYNTAYWKWLDDLNPEDYNVMKDIKTKKQVESIRCQARQNGQLETVDSRIQDYLDRDLIGKESIWELRNAIGVKDKHGKNRLIGMPELERILESKGYQVEKSRRRIDGKRPVVYRITKG